MADNAGPCIGFSSVTKSFGERRVVDDVSFSVPEGGTTCVIGPSGAGKSTLLRMVNLLETPTAGSISVLGNDMTDPGTDVLAVRREVGMVFQHYSLFPHLTIADNVSFPLRKVYGMDRAQAADRALETLESVGAGHLARSYPDQVSGGERQRAAIARALVTAPRIILFDEVTSALDPEHVRGILDLIVGLKSRGITMMVVTHEMSFAHKASDTVLYLDRGRLLEQGTAEQIFKRPQTRRLKEFLDAVG